MTITTTGHTIETALPTATMKLQTAGGGTRSALDSVFGERCKNGPIIMRAKQFSNAVLVSLSAVVLLCYY